MNLSMRTLAAVALLSLAVAGCGGGKSTSTTTTTTTSATAAPMSEAQRETAALPAGNAAPVPAGLNCGAVQPVWVNTHSKAWHEPGDPYYGRTKAGKYMCPSDAASAGFHAAGSRHNSMNGGGTADEGSGTRVGKHHKRHKSDNGMGAADATPTP